MPHVERVSRARPREIVPHAPGGAQGAGGGDESAAWRLSWVTGAARQGDRHGRFEETVRRAGDGVEEMIREQSHRNSKSSTELDPAALRGVHFHYVRWRG